MDKGVRKRNERRYRIEVPLHDEARPRQVAGSLLKPEHRVFRDGEGRIESIAINLEEMVLPANELRQFQSVVASVRLAGIGGMQRVPYDSRFAVGHHLPSSGRVASMEKTAWLESEGGREL
jgi:hypothetical protein